MATLVDIDNVNSYKKCRKKLYDLYVCMPPKNTVVINKFEQADTVRMLNGKTFFTVDELEHMQSNGDGRFNLISQAVQTGMAYVVNDIMPFVLAGTLGELSCVSINILMQNYMFLKDNQPFAINMQTLKDRCGNSQYLDWTAIRTKQDNLGAFACFVPVSQKGQIPVGNQVLNINGAGVSHGKGDFIIAQNVGGRPNLQNRWVVNGEIFAATYNNQGWTDCLSLKHNSPQFCVNINELPKLVSRGSNTGSFDFNNIIGCMQSSHLQSGVGMNYILETVYDTLKSDSIKERAQLCHGIYNNIDIGHGSASVALCLSKPNVPEYNIEPLNNVNPIELIKSAVLGCQDEDKNYNALLFLYKLSSIVIADATIKLFYTNNKYTKVLWKNADTYLITKNKISLYYFNQSQHHVNSDRVCIDFHLSDFKDVFVRFIYTKAGNFGYKFLPKDRVENNGVGATFSINSVCKSFPEMCHKMSSHCYDELLGISNLDKYLLKDSSSEPVVHLIGVPLNGMLSILGAKDEGVDASAPDSYKFKFSVENQERVVYLKDTLEGINLKCTYDNKTIDKTYKLSIKCPCRVLSMLMFTDICKAFKLHPSKELFKSKKFWNYVAESVSKSLNDDSRLAKDTVSKLTRIEPYGINLLDSKYEIKIRLYNQDKVVGERILVVDFNYENFDLKSKSSRSVKVLRELEASTGGATAITKYLVSLYYKYSSGATRVSETDLNRYTSSFDPEEAASLVYWATVSLVESTKKYYGRG